MKKAIALALAILVAASGLVVLSASGARGDLLPPYMQNAEFVSPVAGETWYAGTTHQVKWKPYSNYVEGDEYCEHVKVDLYKVEAGGLQLHGTLFIMMYGVYNSDRTVTSFSWAVPTDLAPGEYQLNVSWGRSGMYIVHVGTCNFYIANGPSDAAPPTISFPEGRMIKSVSKAPSIFVGLSDPDGAVDMGTLEVSVDGRRVAVTNQANGFSIATASLTKGKHTMTVSVADNAGNEATSSWVFHMTGSALKK